MVTAISISIIVSVIMVLIEYFMLLFVKYRVAQQIENKKSKLQIFEGIKNNKPYSQIEEDDKLFIQNNRKYLFFEAIPGPEICFLAFTIEGTLFLLIDSLSTVQKIALGPQILGSSRCIAMLFVFLLISFFSWILTSFWRERIVARIQEKYIKRSFAGIIFMAALCLGFCVYIFIGGR